MKTKEEIKSIDDLMEYINAEIEHFNRLKTDGGLNHDGEIRLEALQYFDELIKKIAPTHPTPDDGWIRVEDELPEYYQTVVCYDSKLKTSYHAARVSDGDTEWYNIQKSNEVLLNVTHWRPLPPLPNQEGGK